MFFYLFLLVSADNLTYSLLSLEREDSFIAFQDHYGKVYGTDAERSSARDMYYKTYDAVKHFVQTSSTVHSIFEWADRDFTFQVDPSDDTRQKIDRVNEQFQILPSTVCVTNPDVFLAWKNVPPRIPRRFDLREKGLMTEVKDQGNCKGGGYAFATTAFLEACILRSTSTYRSNSLYGAYYGYGADRLNLSTQYLLNQSYGFTNYCRGGNFIYLISALANGYIPTVELASDFPFTAGKNPDPATVSKPTPKIPQESYLVPLSRYSLPECNMSLVFVYDDIQYTFNAITIYLIKGFVARGYPVTARITFSSANNEDVYLTSYSDGVISTGCNLNLNTAWHQMLIVGYGHYKGTDVWVMRNSWGSTWGVMGYAYFAVGANSYCSELSAFTAVPKYAELNNNAIFAPNKDAAFIYAKFLNESGKGLDADPGFITPPRLAIPIYGIIILIICISVSISVIGIIVRVIIRRRIMLSRGGGPPRPQQQLQQAQQYASSGNAAQIPQYTNTLPRPPNVVVPSIITVPAGESHQIFSVPASTQGLEGVRIRVMDK